MAEVNYVELYAKAIEENGAGSEVFPDGSYNVKIGSVRKGGSQGGNKPQVGVRLQALDGPYEGKSTWINQTFSGENPKAVAIFIRILESLGVPHEAVMAGVAPADLADYIVVGTTGVADLAHHVYGNLPDGSPKKFQDLKNFRITNNTVAAPAPQPVIQQVQQITQAPAPVAPVVVQQAPVVPPPVPGQPVGVPNPPF